MNPITREEYYLAKIAGTWQGETPEPVTAEEYYLAIMAGDYSGNAPQPVTRLQYYMAKAAGVWNGGIPAPVTRLEYYWAAIANGEGEVFAPITREEYFLMLVADAYSVVLTVVSGNPVLLEGAKGDIGLDSLTLYGRSTQGSTTGAQLLKAYEFTTNFAEGGNENSAKVNQELSAGDIFLDGGYLSFVSREDLPFEVQFEFYDPDDMNYKILALFKPKKGFNKAELTGYKFSDTQKRVSLQIRSVSPPSETISWHISELFVKVGKAESPFEPYTGGKPSPSPEYPQEIESVGQDGEIGVKALGKNLLDIESGVVKGWNIEKLHLDLIPGCTYTYTNFNANVAVALFESTTNTNLTKRYLDAGLSYTFIMPEIDNPEFLLSGAANNWDRSDLSKIQIQVELGDTSTAYEPYKPLQTAIIPTPDGLPGIPVTSGGNYTDADGQQWVCDTIEYRRGKAVRVRMVGKNVVDGEKLKFTESIDKYFWNLPVFTSPDVDETMLTISNYFPIDVFRANSTNDFIWSSPSRMNPYFETPDELNQFCIEKNSEGKPLTIYYCRETPIETPLSPEATAQLAALRTYSPTTTVVNDAGAGMSVGYLKKK